MPTPPPPPPPAQDDLAAGVNRALETYMQNLRGQPCTTLYAATMNAVEAQLIAFALNRCGGNHSATAKLLGISRTTLARKLTAHAIPPPAKTP